jgi:hypothetical protein
MRKKKRWRETLPIDLLNGLTTWLHNINKGLGIVPLKVGDLPTIMD